MAEVVRVKRGVDYQHVLVEVNGKYHEVVSSSGSLTVINADALRGSKGFGSLASATKSGSWRRLTVREKGNFTIMADKPAKKKTYRVPPAVQRSAENALSLSANDGPTQIFHLNELASGNPVSSDTITWLRDSFSANAQKSQSLGGKAAEEWAAKFKQTAIVAAAFAPEDDKDYYATGDDEQAPANATGLIATDENDNVYQWVAGEWFPLPNTIEDFEAPSILEISDEDAAALADWIDDPAHEGEFFVLTDIDPEERNLVDLAYSEIDWDEIDRTEAALTADATGYSPAERSENATRQQRSGDGKFGGPQSPKGETFSAPRARLDVVLPLILDPAARIEEYLAETASNATPTEAEAEEEPVVAAGEEVPAEEAAEPETETLSGDQPLYFAIVDPVDQTAVLDVVSITPDDEGEASAWRRSQGEWTAAPESLADLQGDTPPPVVELEDEPLIKSVLAQVDEYDAGGPKKEEPEPEGQEVVVPEAPITASAAELSDEFKGDREQLAKKGLALPDGSYPIRNVSDLKKAVQAFGRANEGKRAEVKKHIKKRAKALNRKDLIPENWNEASVFDDSHLSPLYGDFGEVVALVAAGGRGNAETLRQYWTTGEGGIAKIRWGTEGDLTRCHRQLNKYMPGRAWGYCQNLHQRIFGMSNAKKDKLAGQ